MYNKNSTRSFYHLFNRQFCTDPHYRCPQFRVSHARKMAPCRRDQSIHFATPTHDVIVFRWVIVGTIKLLKFRAVRRRWEEAQTPPPPPRSPARTMAAFRERESPALHGA